MAINTEREFLNAILDDVGIADEVHEYAQGRLDKLNAQLEARRNKPSKTRLANIEVANTVYEWLYTNGAHIAPEVAEGVGITTQKASSICRQLVAENRATVQDIKIPKKGKMKLYTAVAPDSVE